MTAGPSAIDELEQLLLTGKTTSSVKDTLGNAINELDRLEQSLLSGVVPEGAEKFDGKVVSNEATADLGHRISTVIQEFLGTAKQSKVSDD